MRINVAVPEAHVTKPVLDAALESVTRLDEQLIKENGVPTYQEVGHRIRWKPEPPGQEHFDHAGKILQRGHGDCDDLAPWHCASLRATGEDPGARAVVKRTGPKRWHAVVQRSDGSIDDPSLSSGMPGRKREGVRAPVLQSMSGSLGHDVGGAYILNPQFAARPLFDTSGDIVGFDARVDIPWNHSASDFGADVSMSTLHTAPVASQAVVGALLGGAHVAELSGLVGEDVLDRVDAIREYIEGCECGADDEEILDYLVDKYGPEHAQAAALVGAGFFKKLGRGLKKIAMPILKKTVQFIPGVGPVVSTALDVAEKGIEAAVKSGKKKKRRSAPQGQPVRGRATTSAPSFTHQGKIYVCREA